VLEDLNLFFKTLGEDIPKLKKLLQDASRRTHDKDVYDSFVIAQGIEETLSLIVESEKTTTN